MIPCTSRNQRQSSSKLSFNIHRFIKTAMFTLAILVAGKLLMSSNAFGQIAMPYSESFGTMTTANVLPTVTGGTWIRTGTTSLQPS